jgi:hypothetical protein
VAHAAPFRQKNHGASIPRPLALVCAFLWSVDLRLKAQNGCLDGEFVHDQKLRNMLPFTRRTSDRESCRYLGE